MILPDKASYDLSDYSAVERQMVRNVLNESRIAYDLTEMTLTVEKSKEFQVDAVLRGIELLTSSINDSLEEVDEIFEPSCDFCGNRPAAPLTVRRQVGLVIIGTTYTADNILCNDCGRTMTIEYQKQTAIKGWTGIRSALMNPVVIATNARNRRRHQQELKGR